MAGWSHSDYNASLSSNWTLLELELELSLKLILRKIIFPAEFRIRFPQSIQVFCDHASHVWSKVKTFNEKQNNDMTYTYETRLLLRGPQTN